MKTGLTIQQMAQELLRQSKAKQDYLVNTGSLSLSVTSDVPQLRVTENGLDKITPLDIRQTAHRQLGTYPDIACPVCGGDVNSWDKRCSRALGYRQIVCEGCISEEYQVTVENLRYVMENHFGLVPCPGI